MTDYTGDLRERLRYGTQLHTFILEAIRRRRDFSLQKMGERFDKWRRAEENFLAYLPEKETDKRRKSLRDQGHQQFTTIYIPYDYAILMSAHTYWTSVFLSRSPVFQYMGTQGASQSAEQAVEALIGYQMSAGRILPPMYVWLLDVGKYGVGVVMPNWRDERSIVTREVEVPDTFMGVDLGETKREIRRIALPGYKGNKFFNIRPYDLIPDPRVPLNRMDEGEFCGRWTNLGWNAIAKGAAAGQYFNADVVRKERHNRSIFRDQGSPQVNRPFDSGEKMYMDQMDMSFVELIEMYVELIPYDWGLDSTTYPEKWAFLVANDSVIIQAQPMGLFHNKFPFCVLEIEPDAYSMFKRGMMDLVRPLNETINWLYNTHFYNTRKALNDMFIVDPSMVVMKDVLDPGPGKVIRLREESFGRDVRAAITQLPVTNYTQAHLQDTQLMGSLIQRISGVNDGIMGMLSQGGRKTATEVRTSSTFGINRLKTVAEYFSATGIGDAAMLMLQNSQQLYDQALKLRIAGEAWMTPGAEKFMQIAPADIQGMFDFIPVDGALPVDRFAQVNMWTQLLQQMAASPQVIAQYDVGKIFAFVAQLGGLKNINQFKVQVMPQDQLQQQAQAGNVIPMGGPGGRQPRGAGGRALPPGGAPLPVQVPGMGPAG